MKTNNVKILALFLMIFAGAYSSFAQVKYSLVQDKSTLKVEGTSSMHDWEMNAGDLKSGFVANFEGDNLTRISEVSFSCPAEKILSDNSIMDGKTHDALKAEDHPVIRFNMQSVDDLNLTDSRFTGTISGTLKIAGVTKTVNIDFAGLVKDDESIQVKGVVPLKMSDFDIKPPTAMFGALKTGNEVEIHYDFHFTK